MKAIVVTDEPATGELMPGDGARLGAVDFDTWMAAQRKASGR